MFAYIALSRDPVLLVLKLPLALGAELRAAYPRVVTSGFSWNKPNWINIRLENSEINDELPALIVVSFELVRSSLPKRTK